MRLTRLSFFFLTGFICFLSVASCFAQSESAAVSGRVTDSSGAVVVDAKIQLVSMERDSVQETATNTAGIYVFPAVRPGNYQISVKKEGFLSVDLPNLVANVQAHIEQNFRLIVGSPSESITVRATAEMLDTQTATVSTVVDDQFVQNMPLNGRSFQSLIYLVPGIVFLPTSNQSDAGWNTNGQRASANQVSVDGVSANFGGNTYGGIGFGFGSSSPGLTSDGGTNGLISVDAMQEFRIQTSTFAPEFGRTPGAQVGITSKGGSNLWHGTAFEYLRNDVFDARNYFNWAQPYTDSTGYINPAQKKSPVRQNNFGGTVGGPIVRDKTFFFFSYENNIARQPHSLTGYYLTAETKANLSGPWATLMNATPTGPSIAAGGVPVSTTCDEGSASGSDIPCATAISTSSSNPSDLKAYSIRMDGNLSKKLTLFGRYNHAPSDSAQQQLIYTSDNIVDVDTVTLGLTYSISPTLVNDLRGNWSRSASSQVLTDKAVYGAVPLTSSSLVFSPSSGWSFSNAQVSYNLFALGSGVQVGNTVGYVQGSLQRQWNFVDTLSKIVGRHQLKFGGDLRRLIPTNQGSRVEYLRSISWAKAQQGLVNVDINVQDMIRVHMDNFSLFGQDTWKISPKLTMTYGVRWELNPAPASDTGGKPLYAVQGIFDSNAFGLAPVGTPMWNTQKTAVAPRIGLAYSVAPKTVIRGGFGVFYDLPSGGAASMAMGQSFPWFRDSLHNNVLFDSTSSSFDIPPLSLDLDTAALSQIAAVDPNIKMPISLQWNVAFERELGKNRTISATYLGADGRRLLRTDDIFPAGWASVEGIAYSTHNGGYSHYNALQFQFMQRMSHRLEAMISYSYSHNSDTNSSNYINGMGATTISQVPTPPLSLSDYDIPNSIQAMVSYQLAKPQWGGRAGKAVLGGWSVDGVFRLQSGPPLNPQISYYNTDNGVSFNVQPDRVRGVPVWIKDSFEPSGKMLNIAAFAFPTNAENGVNGDFPRNSICSPYGFDQTDLALRRRFSLTERVTFDIRAEYFNLFNHPMFGPASLAPAQILASCDIGSGGSACALGDTYPEFGRISSQTTMNGGGNASLAGQNPLYAPGGPRSAQFTAKFIF
jgi:hypothetical protein